jgi:hypothetical protein
MAASGIADDRVGVDADPDRRRLADGDGLNAERSIRDLDASH